MPLSDSDFGVVFQPPNNFTVREVEFDDRSGLRKQIQIGGRGTAKAVQKTTPNLESENGPDESEKRV